MCKGESILSKSTSSIRVDDKIMRLNNDNYSEENYLLCKVKGIGLLKGLKCKDNLGKYVLWRDRESNEWRKSYTSIVGVYGSFLHIKTSDICADTIEQCANGDLDFINVIYELTEEWFREC